jgi:cytochrome c-type biogenesis protein CcmH
VAATGPAAHLNPAEMVAQLQARIALAPNDPEPRLWLARVYMAGAQYAEAVTVFEALAKIMPDQPEILLQYADALAMAARGTIGAQATALIQRALKIDPDNMTGLWLAEVAADQAGNAGQALDYLRRARRASAGSETPTTDLDAFIKEIETRSGLRAEVGDDTSAPPPAANTASISVAVSVDPAAAAGLAPESIVFVLAKAVNGPPMPLAVKRLTLGELPQHITLDDSLAMAPQFKLSGVEQVMVIARISRSGEPIAHTGDVEGKAGPLKVGVDTAVKIVINTPVP